MILLESIGSLPQGLSLKLACRSAGWLP